MSSLHEVTAPVLLDGLLGGVIGTVGAFGAALLALWYDRRQQRQQASERAAAEREVRRRRAAAALTGLLRTLEAEIRWAPFFRGRTMLALSSAMLVFEAEVGAEHPEVTHWLTDRYDELVVDLQRWQRVWWIPVARNRRVRPVAHSLGQLTAILTAWSTGRVSDAGVAEMRFGALREVDEGACR